MKIKSLLFSLVLLPTVLFGATNAFDNVLIKTSLQLTFGTPGAGKVLTSDANGYSTWSTVMSAGGGDVFTASNNVFLANNTFQSNLISTNGVSGASTNYLSTIRLFARQTDGVLLNFIGTNGANIGNVQWDGFQGFSLGTSNVTMQFNGQLNTLNLFSGQYVWDANGHVNNGNLSVIGTLSASSNVAFGSFAGNTATFNGTTVTAPNTLNFNANTMFVTNGGVAFGTNLILTTETVRIQGGSGANATALTVVEGPAGSAVPIQAWKSANGTTGMQVISNATALLIGAAQYTVVGVNLLNASGDASVVNNTASTGASLSLGGGTGSGTRVLIKTGGTTVGNFSTNQVNLNGKNFSATTNSTLMGPFLSVSGNVIPGSIAANTTYVTNFALANSVTNGAYMKILPPFFENVNFRYEVGCPSNGFVQIYIHNDDLVSAHTASNGVYGTTGIMPAL